MLKNSLLEEREKNSMYILSIDRNFRDSIE